MLPLPELDVADPLSRSGQADERGEIPIGVGADHEVHPRDLLEQSRTQPLGHAAHHAEDVAGTLVPLKLAHPPDYPLLGIVADGAGVDQHDVRVARILGADIPLAPEETEHQLGIGHVHLAAVGLDVDPFGHGQKIAQAAAGRLAQGRTATPIDSWNTRSLNSPAERQRYSRARSMPPRSCAKLMPLPAETPTSVGCCPSSSRNGSVA